ncbi:hypothetical protein DPMN_107395 [Dreissena polymorpha]|uniref:Uncharacterized protein n=1 Tax=Dreissena polymorpha TaxID=45954 RepID=A0A9D4QL01_DREPO|nr:hypothetical protein DPMN_107395 [Dreissena polymorpha]
MVDEAFMDFLGMITDKKAVQRFKDESMEDYIELLRDFEIKKRALDNTKDGKVTIKIPVSLSDLAKDVTGMLLQDTLHKTRYGKQVSVAAGGKLRVDADVMRSFFSSSMSKIVDHVSGLLQKPECSGVEAILMVGGYSESLLLQETTKKQFPTLKIIVPTDAGLAVLKGAVIYGHCPSAITERVSKYTYGIEVADMFIIGEHPLSKRTVYEDGSTRCKEIFSKLVEAGDKLIVDEAQNEKSYSPIYDQQKSLAFPIYVTSDRNPKYTTDIGCKQIGSVEVPLAGSGTERAVTVRMIFGGTEITVECEEESTGRITRLIIDFLM